MERNAAIIKVGELEKDLKNMENNVKVTMPTTGWESIDKKLKNVQLRLTNYAPSSKRKWNSTTL